MDLTLAGQSSLSSTLTLAGRTIQPAFDADGWLTHGLVIPADACLATEKDYDKVAESTDGRKGRRAFVSLRVSDMLDIVSVVCPRIDKCLAALDGCTENHGRLNFKVMRDLFVTIVFFKLYMISIYIFKLLSYNYTS